MTQLDAPRNRVVVGGREELLARQARLEGVHWIQGRGPATPIRARVRVRYRDTGAPAVIEPGPQGSARLEFESPVAAVAPGQAAVFDRGDVVLGGGWIAAAGP